MSDDSVNCGNGGGSQDFTHLRIASVFIIMAASGFGAFFPVVANRTGLKHTIPNSVFEFAKYFGSGVIIATAFIHLLAPGVQELTSPCLGEAWQLYPYSLALCMLSIFGIFFVELIAFRWGTAKLKELGITHDPHGHQFGGSHAAHGPEQPALPAQSSDDIESGNADIKQEAEVSVDSTHNHGHSTSTIAGSPEAQILGIFILEFGIILHSVLIGLTLAVDDSFKILFVVIVFHQMFEGLGLGSRLAFLRLPKSYNYVAFVAAGLYAFTTPIGIAVGLGVRSTYNPDGTRATLVSGILDSLSAGILLYTGLVELLAHEFLFSPSMTQAKNGKVAYACICMLFGAGIMALLGRWA